MRCTRCGRRVRRLRTGRLPDGRLAFAWCAACLGDAHLRSLGLAAASDHAPARSASKAAAAAGTSAIVPEVADRAAGLRGLGVLLTAWGLLLVLVGAGSWLGFGGPDDGFGPTRIGRSRVFAVSGAFLAVLGAWTGLASLGRGDRTRTLARSIEAAALGLGVSLLVVGIAFHDPSRDPWVAGGFLLSVVAARAARHWARPRGRPVRSIEPS
jgi:hypothetical protein